MPLDGFLRGRGSDVDAEAALFYLKATLLGHALSPVEIGRVYFEGKLTEKDVVAAHFWWSVARDRNAPGARVSNSLSQQMTEAQNNKLRCGSKDVDPDLAEMSAGLDK